MYISEKYAQSSDLDLDHSVHAMKFMIADRDIKERRKPRAHQIVKHFDKHSLTQTKTYLKYYSLRGCMHDVSQPNYNLLFNGPILDR